MIKKNIAITFQHEFNKQQNFKNTSESKSRQHLRSCMISISMLKTYRPSVCKQLKFILSLVLKMELFILNRKGQMLFRYLRKMINNRVRFNDSWFLFQNSSWSIQESYLRWKHMFHEKCRVDKIVGFKPANRHQIIPQSSLSTISIINHFFVKQKLCKHYFLRSRT